MAHDEAYYQAEKKIAQALKSGATELDLSVKIKAPDDTPILNELPESLVNLTQLQSLNLSNNQLRTLPESLGNLTQLKKLFLSNNQLIALPESFGNLAQLQELTLSDNRLTALPESFGDLAQLKKLDIVNNRLTALPKLFGNLTRLNSLHIAINQLTTLPNSFKNLIQLEELDLQTNPLSELPDVIRTLSRLSVLIVYNTKLKEIPEWLSELKSLTWLGIGGNQIVDLPYSISEMTNLEKVFLGVESGGNPFTQIPKCISKLKQLKFLFAEECQLISVPEWVGNLKELEEINLQNNHLINLPTSLVELEHLKILELDYNPLNPELAEAYEQGLDAVKIYLRAKAESQIILNEAKLILIGEGEVGKSCLLDALLDKPFQTHESTHGIEIQSFNVTTESQTSITLNAWDFGGQRVYRPTHQLFFSAPAVYLVVWKPREGSQAGQVKEWIQLVKRREPSAKILVVATHGGPQQRQPDMDRQELWDLFGKETVVDFFFVESKPDAHGNRKGIDELKRAIAQVAASLPEVGRSVPKSFADVRQALQDKGAPYLQLREVLEICRAHNMDGEIARLFIIISHRLGHLTHYENDPTLRDIVILRPDWLATAISYVLDDEATRDAHGLVKFSRLAELWDDKNRATDSRYPSTLHPIFLRLMERFDLSYRVADLTSRSDSDPISLIGQLVPDIRPQNISDAWKTSPASGDIQQTQICHIVDASNGQSASAEGLFYQLIVRLHKYSLGRADYNASLHWQRGLVLEDEYKSRAFLEHVGNDVRITVRSPYPEGLLGMLTREVKFLVESFWEGLRCDVMVPCIEPCGKHMPGTGLYNVSNLMESKREGESRYPCPVCNKWQNIDSLLRNAPAAAEPISLDYLEKKFAEVVNKMNYQGEKMMNRFDRVDDHDRRILSMADKIYTDLLQVLTDEAKEGPRMFSLVPVNRSGFNPKQWTSEKFKLILWCEHARKPLPFINGKDSQNGVYEIERTREWFVKAAPFLKIMTQALSLALPIATAGIKLEIDKAAYDFFADQITFSKEIIDATLSASDKADLWKDAGDSTNLPQGFGIRSENATLRELHAFLKERDPGFGGLVRVMNKRQEFLWVHEKFAGEY